MPITREQYERGDFNSKHLNNDNYVLKFLQKHDKAYRPEELAKIFKKSGSIIRQHLRKLIKQGLVERTSPWYILKKKKSVVKKNSKKKK